MTTTRITITSADEQHALDIGDAITFGRDPAGDGPVPSARHLGLGPDPSLHAHAGTVSLDDAGCLLEATGRWLHLLVTPVDGPDRADVAPGRSLRVPWPRARVEVATGQSVVGFDLEQHGAALLPVTPAMAGDTVAALDLDRTAGYFRALVALCEPRLRHPGSHDVASAAQIARTLNRLAGERERVTPKAVERRLAHVRSRVGIGGRDPHGISAAGLEVRDAARQLADLALRTGTVTAADLAIVTPDEPDGPDGPDGPARSGDQDDRG